MSLPDYIVLKFLLFFSSSFFCVLIPVTPFANVVYSALRKLLRSLQISRPEDFDRSPDPRKYFVQFFGTSEM